MSRAHADLPPKAAAEAVDYRIAFELAPIGMVLSRARQIVDCNLALARMFRTPRELLLGRSFSCLYPSADEFEHTGARIAANLRDDGCYADDRIMKREIANPHGELFWCHVSGRALEPSRPHEAGIWTFEDLSERRPLTTPTRLTAREREIAALLIDGLTSKQIGKTIGVSPRTVDIYRARLLRKYGAATTPELVHRLLTGA